VDPGLCQVPEGPAHQFTYERLGVNVEMSELNACFGRWQLRDWDSMEAKRQRNYRILYEALKDVKHLKVWEEPKIHSSAFVFPVRLLDGKTIYDAYRILLAEGIEIRTLMGGVSNEQKAFSEVLGSELQKNAHEVALTTFFVGIHQTLPEEDVRAVAEKLKALL
jgi:CDP-6-deoxy-D-xylo-4-hexulose-3-dehydrase